LACAAVPGCYARLFGAAVRNRDRVPPHEGASILVISLSLLRCRRILKGRCLGPHAIRLEGTVETINWRRVFLGGTLAGVVLIVLATAFAALFIGQQELRTAVRSFHLSASGSGALLFFVFVFLLLGILMTWWYAAIRPRFGAGPKTAAIAGLAVWLVAVGQMLKSVAMYEPSVNLPPGPVLPILYLAMIVASTEVGAWVYTEEQRSQRQGITARQ